MKIILFYGKYNLVWNCIFESVLRYRLKSSCELGRPRKLITKNRSDFIILWTISLSYNVSNLTILSINYDI